MTQGVNSLWFIKILNNDQERGLLFLIISRCVFSTGSPDLSMKLSVLLWCVGESKCMLMHVVTPMCRSVFVSLHTCGLIIMRVCVCVV